MPSWAWKGIGGAIKGPFVDKVMTAMKEQFNVTLTPRKGGGAFVKGSGTGQPHLQDTALVPIDLDAPGDTVDGDDPCGAGDATEHDGADDSLENDGKEDEHDIVEKY